MLINKTDLDMALAKIKNWVIGKLFYSKGTLIPNGADLNDYIVIGNYYCVDSSQVTNAPVTTTTQFSLKVIETPLGIRQMAYYSNNVYIISRRYTYSTQAWSQWNTDIVKNRGTNGIDLGTAILTGDLNMSDVTWTGLTRPFFRRPLPASNDLNDCLETGLYYVGTGSGSGATANIPVAYAGYCITFNATASYTLQFYTRLGSTNRVLYMRKYSSGTWASWGSISFTAI